MQEFTKEWKAIQKALSNCWSEKSAKGDALPGLEKARRKIFADIAVGKVSPSKKKIINSEIRQLKQDIEDIDIAVEELELRQTLIKRQGAHIQEVKED
ncbi:unnamed protein product [marine sediment metagenome]|uniref:Uncharacterized protein n=1 Tax=marine sediment metagenome TaxID=412755 RepID=X1TDV1_9ZZZZ